MGNSFNLTLGNCAGKKLIVISHERSGTHFLMNTLAENYGYISNPWVNLDAELGVDFYCPTSFKNIFTPAHDKPVLNIFKSHHASGFLDQFADYLDEQFHILYIYRDPRDVMVSFWRILQTYAWDRGPKTATVGEFMRSTPFGGILRYQKFQAPTILDRWKAHVEGWADCAESWAKDQIILLQYEDLHFNFEETVNFIGDRLGKKTVTAVRPSRNENVIYAGKGGYGSHQEFFKNEDYTFIQQTVGDTMQKLNIPWDRS